MWNNIFSIEKRSKIFPWLLLVLALFSVLSFWVVVKSFQAVQKKAAAVRISPFDSVKISGKSAIVFDMAKSKAIYEKNADEPRPLASLTKIMTALTATELASSTKTVSFASSTWSLKNLIDYTLLVSSNSGASAIASLENTDKKTFIAKMNALSKKIGLTNSKFINEHGLDESPERVGAYGSARDMALLFKYIITHHPHLLEATKYPALSIKDQAGAIYPALNTNISVNQIPSLLASKTGFTDLAGGNLVVAYDAGLGEPVIISVLGSTQSGRFDDVLKLIGATEAYIKNDY